MKQVYPTEIICLSTKPTLTAVLGLSVVPTIVKHYLHVCQCRHEINASTEPKHYFADSDLLVNHFSGFFVTLKVSAESQLSLNLY